MFPFCFEWVWDVGHYMFFGGFWYTVTILGVGMTFCIAKAAYDTMNDDGESHGDSHH